MPARPGYAHSEDLPWLEVPQSVSAAETEPDNCGSMVPSICGETFWGLPLRITHRATKMDKKLMH